MGRIKVFLARRSSCNGQFTNIFMSIYCHSSFLFLQLLAAQLAGLCVDPPVPKEAVPVRPSNVAKKAICEYTLSRTSHPRFSPRESMISFSSPNWRPAQKIPHSILTARLLLRCIAQEAMKLCVGIHSMIPCSTRIDVGAECPETDVAWCRKKLPYGTFA